MQQHITVVHADEVRRALKKLGEDAPAALRIATTNLGEHAQRTMRREIGNRFTFRGTRAGFERAVVFQAPKVTATRKITALLKVGSDQGGTKATATRNLGILLARHEEADTRTESGQVFFDGRGKAMTGLGFFMPAKGLRTDTANPARKLYPAAIGAAMRLDAGGKLILAKGTKKGSKRSGTGVSYFATRSGIFRRKHTGFGRADVEAIWWFRSRVRTPARLGLWSTAQKVFEQHAVGYALDAVDTVLDRTSPTRLL